MSYADQQNLSVDSEFTDRVWAALCTEGQAKPPTDPTAQYVLDGTFKGVNLFMPRIATAPTFGDLYASGGQEAITDLQLLSAVQAAWPLVVLPATP